MSKKLAIKGHATRGEEIIGLLKMLGGKNTAYHGTDINVVYTIDDKGIIRSLFFNDSILMKMEYNIFTLEEFLEKYPYKVGDKVVYEDDNDIVVINEIKWDNTVGDIFYNVKRIEEDDCFLCPPELLKPYKETNMNENKCTQCVYAVNNNHCGLRGFRSNFNVNYCSAQNTDKLPNGFELQEDGYFSWVNKKPKYPTTYVECCKVLFPHSIELGKVLVSGYNCEKLKKFGELLICRDAYWKIAGEEMGLDKPWKPDWIESSPKYTITVIENKFEKRFALTQSYILAFPTEEMRDAFYENFNDLIEQCKELL